MLTSKPQKHFGESTMPKTSSYRESLIEALADPIEAKYYLRAVLEDYPRGFLKAVRNVAQAHQMSKVAEEAGIQRESLYRALSDDGNPRWFTINPILAALGLRITVETMSEMGHDHPAPTPSTRDMNFSIGAILPPDPLRTSGQKVVCITRGILGPSGQKREDTFEENNNQPVLQEALCK